MNKNGSLIINIILGYMIYSIVSIYGIEGVLLQNIGTPSSYNWDSIISATSDADYKSILQVLKRYSVHSATIGIQLNPSPTYISQVPPTTWRNPQYWWGVGYGISYDSTMRGASISKPLTAAIWHNNDLLSNKINLSFYRLWESYIGNLPEPKDIRVKDITIQHLINHKSGFSNTIFGFDPAFQGTYVESQISSILTNYNLASTPGTLDNYSNFGYMILGKLAEGITGKSYITLARELFPTSIVPVYGGNNNIQANKEVATYYLQGTDGYFNVEPMKGNGNIVSNAITWSWFATQYWINGPNIGKKFTSVPSSLGATWVWIFDGSMPGTSTVLIQYVNTNKQVSSICILMNQRNPSSNLLNDLNTVSMNFLTNKFA